MSGVRTEHQQFIKMKDVWQMCRDASGGERAVHSAGEKYLPRLDEEESDAYNLRLQMTPWFNATWRTIAGLRGMMFQKPPLVDATESLLDDIKDVDLAGASLHELAELIAEEALTVGRVGIMVDYPSVDTDTMTQADVKAQGLRVSMVMYKAETIINWRMSRVNGATSLGMVVLQEYADIEVQDEFESKKEARYRVLDMFEGKYRQRVFRINDKNEDEQLSLAFPKMNGAPLDYIPFLFVGVDSSESGVDEPPLIDLINTNFKHYGQATSYERGCFYSGLPTLFVTGYSPNKDEQIYIGGNVANVLPGPQANAFYVEVKGDFTALRTNLEDKKREMAALGARMLEMQKAGVEAADALARRQNGEESLLSSMAQSISKGLTRAFQWFADWQNVNQEVKFELNRDFLPTKMDAATLTAMIAAWQVGGFSKETLFVNLQRGGIIADGTTFEEEEAKIENEGPMLGAMPIGAVPRETEPTEEEIPE